MMDFFSKKNSDDANRYTNYDNNGIINYKAFPNKQHVAIIF